jgi:hypothetical protein
LGADLSFRPGILDSAMTGFRLGGACGRLGWFSAGTCCCIGCAGACAGGGGATMIGGF